MDKIISNDRYQRQMLLKNFGEAGQQKLLHAAVLVIGAGGLGCAVMQYLAAAGIGRIGIVDDDTVALSNLHRQVLYSTDDIGLPKARLAARVLNKLNKEIEVIAYCERLTTQNAFSLLRDYDIVIDCTDNFATRYLINDACVLLDKPLVFGAVSQYEGQVAIFNHKTASNTAALNYRDLFPHPPMEGEILNCAEGGVLGVLPGIIGTIQASETIKLLTGIGRPLTNRLLTFDALNNNMYELELTAHEETRLLIPSSEAAFLQTDYDLLCSTSPEPFEIDSDFFSNLLTRGNIDVVDVRELHEVPVIEDFSFHHIPLGQLTGNLELLKSNTVVTICQSGRRSLRAAKQLAGIFGTTKTIYSLSGGIIQWKQAQENQFL